MCIRDRFRCIQRANKYIDETAPWVLAKDEANRPRLAAVLYNLCETLRFAATLLQPFMPQTAPKIAAQLGLDAGALTYDALGAFGSHAAYTVHKGEALFPRIDAEKELEELRMEKDVYKRQGLDGGIRLPAGWRSLAVPTLCRLCGKVFFPADGRRRTCIFRGGSCICCHAAL